MEPHNRPRVRGRGIILTSALVILAIVAASQRPITLTGQDLLAITAVTTVMLAAGLVVRLGVARTHRNVVPPPPHFAPARARFTPARETSPSRGRGPTLEMPDIASGTTPLTVRRVRRPSSEAGRARGYEVSEPARQSGTAVHRVTVKRAR